MRPPETIYVMGLPIGLRIIDGLKVDGKRCRGAYDVERCCIEIDAGVRGFARPLIFWHEASHTAIDLIWTGGEKLIRVPEEHACNVAHLVRGSVEGDPRNTRLLRWLKGK